MRSIIILFITLIGFPFKGTEDRKILLSGNSSKSWRIAAFSTDGAGTSCESSSEVIQDDSYTFFAEGNFVFDGGEILYEPDDECETVASASGFWRLNVSEDSLIMTLSEDITMSYILLLQEDSMVINTNGGTWVAFVPLD